MGQPLASVGVSSDWQRFSILLDILVITWALYGFNRILLGKAMDWLAIRPRSLIGLLGIVFAPLLHANITHLLNNSILFLGLGWLLLLQGETVFWSVSVIVVLVCGLSVWLFGRDNTVHLGASGVICGYMGFLLFSSLFNHNLLSLLLSLTVGVLYWELLPNVLSRQPGVSWESHWFGFLSGILAAWILLA